MKKCEKCKFYRQYNNYDELINLCMYFCENRLPKDKCISEKGYIEKIQNEYNEFINSDKFNYHLFSYGNKEICDIVYKYGKNKENCKQKIIEHMNDLNAEILQNKGD